MAKKVTKKKAQPEISIGLVGHVDHGKTTLVKALSGKWTDVHSEELKRGITIRLGYADATLYKRKDGSYTVEAEGATPVRIVSFVDAPGHESLMATMLSGAAIIDAALLIVSAAEHCPQPQTREHLQALEIIGISNLIVVQNKIDLVSEKAAKKNYKEIKAFLKGTPFVNAPIIPVSAMHGINIDVLIETMQEHFATPKRDPSKDPLMFVARSFDVNRPGSEVDKMIGGVLGGSIKQGKLTIGQEIEIMPGYEVEEKNKKVWKPFSTKIVGLMAGGQDVKEAGPGGSIAVLTELDPSVVKSDKLTGAVIGSKGKTPPVHYSLELDIKLLKRVVGAKDQLVVESIKLKEPLMLNVYSAATVGIVTQIQKNKLACTLKRPMCAELGARVTISRMVGNRWRLIGYGIIR